MAIIAGTEPSFSHLCCCNLGASLVPSHPSDVDLLVRSFTQMWSLLVPETRF